MRLARLAALVAALAVTTSVYAADATYPSDDTICPLLHEHIECRANGDCGPYNYTGRDGFWDLYDAAKPSTLSNATQTCYGLTNATSCDGNSLCQWAEQYAECYPKHTEVIDILTDDGAPAPWIGVVGSPALGTRGSAQNADRRWISCLTRGSALLYLRASVHDESLTNQTRHTYRYVHLYLR